MGKNVYFCCCLYKHDKWCWKFDVKTNLSEYLTNYFLWMNINMPMNNSVWTRMRPRHFVLFKVKWTFLHTCCLSVNVCVFVLQTLSKNHLNHLMTKPTIWLCAQRRLRSFWASAQSDQSLCCPHEERLEPYLPIERTAKALKCPRLNLFEAFNVIAIKLVVILNHFPGDKSVFYGIYLTLWLECTLLVSTDSDLVLWVGFLLNTFLLN